MDLGTLLRSKLYQPSLKGVTPMSQVTVVSILSLIGKLPSEDQQLLDASPDIIKASLQRKQEEAKAQAADEAADQIIQLLKDSSRIKNSSLSRLREIRADERWLLKRVKEIDRAQEYGKETLNYLPLAKLLNGYVSGQDDLEDPSLLEVPKDWAPKTETPVA